MKKVYQGETVSLYFEHRSSGVLTDASTSAKIAIKDSSGQIVVAATTDLPKIATGKYQYDYNIDVAAKTGVYTAQAIFTSGSNVNRQGVIVFEVCEKIG